MISSIDLTKQIVAWRVIDKDNELIAYGMEEYDSEFDLDKLPGGWCGDRTIDEVQSTMAEINEWKTNGYKFEYRMYTLTPDLKLVKGW